MGHISITTYVDCSWISNEYCRNGGTVGDNKKFTFYFVKTTNLLCKNHCNVTSLHLCSFYTAIVFTLFNPLATNATIVALVLKNEITYYEIMHS